MIEQPTKLARPLTVTEWLILLAFRQVFNQPWLFSPENEARRLALLKKIDAFLAQDQAMRDQWINS